MSDNSLSMNNQLATLTRACDDCRGFSDQLNNVRKQIADVTDQRDEELEKLSRTNDRTLTEELQRISNEAASRIDTLGLDTDARQQSLRDQRERQIEDMQSVLREQVNALEEQRDNESWVLQSVYDEDSTDSPAAHFDREAETVVTQKSFLDERFENLEQQIEQTRSYLAECHSSAGDELPEATLESSLKRSQLREAAIDLSDSALTESGRLEQFSLPHWIRGWRLWGGSVLGFLAILIPVVMVKADLRAFINPEISNPDWQWLVVASLISLVAVILISTIVVFIVQSKLRNAFESVMQHVINAEAARKRWERKSEQHLEKMEQAAERWRNEITTRREQAAQKVQDTFNSRIDSLRQETSSQVTRVQNEFLNREQSLAQYREVTEKQIEDWRKAEEVRIRKSLSEQLTADQETCRSRSDLAINELRLLGEKIIADWKASEAEIRLLTQQSRALVGTASSWPELSSGHWNAPEAMPRGYSVADLLVTLPRPVDSIDERDSANLCVELPAVVRFPNDTSILVEHDAASRESALSFIRCQLLRLLAIIPPGRIRLTLIDPVGLGQSFSAMMHLTDFDELLIHSRIWTDSSQIRDQLQKVTEHMENVFQTYLRSQFDSIEEYNESAGEVAEPYHFVVVAGFPTAFSEEAARHLSSILTSGPRCGVHAIVAWNPTIAAPPSFDTDELTSSCVRFVATSDGVQPHVEKSDAILFEPFPEPPADQYVRMVRAVGEASKDARRVEVSFNRIAPKQEAIWSHSTADGIDLPIGRAGAARLQYMRLGRGTSQHVLIAGKTGSGKSTFLHILITNLALHYSPDEIQFYLIDFKKGVEFRSYAAHQLPHARVIAIESDREFGLSVLERLDQVLQERGELFRSRGVQDVPSFRQQFPEERMPRLMLLIDEFQEFFVAEDRVSSRASLLLDRLIRQGRAFGIHVLLGSQTLGGAYSLARSTMGQVAVRIALQCSESDAHLILSEDNSAARLLTRPGEAIYNDANGLVEGNHPFQIAWLDEDRREHAIESMPVGNVNSGDRSMVVFEGNVAPTAALCGPLNAHFRNAQDATRRQYDASPIWLGEPVAIAAPTQIELKRASGQNLLIVGQDDSLADNILAMSVLSTCLSQNGGEKASDDNRKLILLHSDTQSDSRTGFDTLVSESGIKTCQINQATEAQTIVEELHQELLRREENAESANAEELILVVRNIGQFRDLRRDEDEFGLGGFGESKPATTASLFGEVIKRGPLVGLHVIIWADTFSNATRWLSNALMREFENRIAFRMNQTDSASLVDSPIAASMVPGRAVLYRDQTGTCEKFRPFAWPSSDWLKSLVGNADDLPATDMDIDSLTIE